jgi:hypothetical protein
MNLVPLKASDETCHTLQWAATVVGLSSPTALPGYLLASAKIAIPL